MGYPFRVVTVRCANGMRLVIYLNDHPPAHVHFFGDGKAKIDLLGTRGVLELIWADCTSRVEVRRAMRLVAEHQAFLLQRWKDIHGGSD